MTTRAMFNLNKTLDSIERIGNRLPHPTVLFIYFALFTLLISYICSILGLSATHPVTQEPVIVNNLLNQEGLHKILTGTVKNFTQFAPVGTVLVAILGIGIAEHSGLLRTLIQLTILKAPQKYVTFIVVLTGVLSSIAVDSGYVVLIPVAALVFKSVGRPAIAGIAAAFAGVSGGFSANLLIGPTDAILAGLSTEAAKLIDPSYSVSAAGNYYFIIASTFLVSIVATFITERIILKRFESDTPLVEHLEKPSAAELKGLKAVLFFSIAFVICLLWASIPDDGLLRDPKTGSLIKSPFIYGIVTIIAFYAGVCGILFGKVSGKYHASKDWIQGMEIQMQTMASYLVLMFFAAQFVAYFSWSNLGVIIAINGAHLLQSLTLPPAFLVVLFILLAASINLFIGSASAKWALIAPIFIPMLLLAGMTPEGVQMAYRIGDSSTNIITPLMPYFGVVIAFAQQHDKNIGMGSIIATMLPYSIALLLSWSALLVIWLILDLPLGPGAYMLT